MKEAYISEEVAALLQQKGFHEPCTGLNKILCKIGKKPLLLITQQKAMKWLREVHNLFLDVGFGADAKGKFLYMADIYNLKNDAIDGIYKPIVEADDYLLNNPKLYEDACEAGIKYCLEYLI